MVILEYDMGLINGTCTEMVRIVSERWDSEGKNRGSTVGCILEMLYGTVKGLVLGPFIII